MISLPCSSELSHKTNVLLASASLVGWIWMCVGNALTFVVVKSPGEISDKYWTPITPAGWAFAIWSLIFILTGVHAIWSLVLAIRGRPYPQLVLMTCWFCANTFLNGVWNFIFGSELITLAAVWLYAIMLTCIGLYVTMDCNSRTTPLLRPSTGDTASFSAFTFADSSSSRFMLALQAFLDALVSRAPFRLYMGWMTCATIVMTTLWLQHIAGFGSDPEWTPVPPQLTPAQANAGGYVLSPPIQPADATWAVIILGVALVLGTVIAVAFGDWIYMSVIAWATFAIASKSSGYVSSAVGDVEDSWQLIATAALGYAIVDLVIAVGALALELVRGGGLVNRPVYGVKEVALISPITGTRS